MSVFAFLLILPGSICLWPLLARWLNRADHPCDPLTVGLVSLGLSSALVSLLMTWLGVIGVPLTGFTAGIGISLLITVSITLNPGWFDPRRWWDILKSTFITLKADPVQAILAAALTGALLMLMLHALYYPFIASDTLSRYGLHAKLIVISGAQPVDVYGYPQMVQMWMAISWLLSGSFGEGLAKLLPYLLSAGAALTVIPLAREMGHPRAGLAAALLVAITPIFVAGATNGYLDAPSSFTLTLTALFALRWWRTTDDRDALLTGLLFAAALWTKQSALTWAASLPAIVIGWWVAHRGRNWQSGLHALALMLLPALLLVGPWFLRNYIIGGSAAILPSAGSYHVDQAVRTPLNLVPSLYWRAEFGPAIFWLLALGWVVGFGRGLWQGVGVLKGQMQRPDDLLLLAMVVPYWASWLLRFTFDARFLLLILPLMALWAGELVAWGLGWLDDRPAALRYAVLGIGALWLVAALYTGTYDRLRGMAWVLRDPFASYEIKQMRFNARQYGLAQYAYNHFDPQADHLCVMEAGMLYYLVGYDVEVRQPYSVEDVAGCDYLFHSSSFWSVYDRLGWTEGTFFNNALNPDYFETLINSDDVQLMRVRTENLPMEGSASP